jgi:tetratricopeptide (TPR) repeat protein
VVYKAVQHATKRTVALKVLLEGPYASDKQRHRFEREIDLVASLQHPNIVTIYDSGVTSDRRHYFAMEYIHGKQLDAYLASSPRCVDETLRLFQKICTAVSYAHQRGVIHRDLKPGNIRIDANGEPHVLDFGLAKSAGPDLQGGAPVTVTGQFMGTLAYASPEQTKADPNLVDIRTDIYSLGVVLYEMLTGMYPYEVAGQLADVLRNIAETEPKKPSSVRSQVNDEVETIVLKALAKDRDRRYQSTEALARDIEHYLAGEPIDAKRDSTWYVIRKSLRRYRRDVSVATAFVLLLVGLGLAWNRAKVGRSEVVKLLKDNAVGSVKDGQWQDADAALVKALEASPDNARVMYMRAWSRQRQASTVDAPNARTILADADRICRRARQLDPRDHWGLNIHGVVLKKLERYDDAIDACKESVAADPDYYAAWVNLGSLHALKGDFRASRASFERAIKLAGRATDEEAVETWRNFASLLLHLADRDALVIIEKALGWKAHDPGTYLISARIHLDLDGALDSRLALAQVQTAYMLTRRRPDPRVARIRALAHLRNGQLEEAVEYGEEAIRLNDMLAIDHLIIAIAEAHHKRMSAAREHLQAALNDWPADLEDAGVIVTAPNGVLWFETAAEINRLREEAERAIHPQSR